MTRRDRAARSALGQNERFEKGDGRRRERFVVEPLGDQAQGFADGFMRITLRQGRASAPSQATPSSASALSIGRPARSARNYGAKSSALVVGDQRC